MCQGTFWQQKKEPLSPPAGGPSPWQPRCPAAKPCHLRTSGEAGRAARPPPKSQGTPELGPGPSGHIPQGRVLQGGGQVTESA